MRLGKKELCKERRSNQLEMLTREKKCRNYYSKHSPFRIRLLFLVQEHFVACDVRRVTRDMQAVGFDTIRHIVVFATPAPENVTESVHQLKVFARHRGHAAKQIGVGQPEDDLTIRNQRSLRLKTGRFYLYLNLSTATDMCLGCSGQVYRFLSSSGSRSTS